MTYTFHHDDGHGWLEVPYQDMLNVGVTLEDVSRFSYAVVISYKPTVFLEEDIDIGVFMLAMKKAEMQETLDQIELIVRDAIQNGGHALALVNILRELQAHKERV